MYYFDDTHLADTRNWYILVLLNGYPCSSQKFLVELYTGISLLILDSCLFSVRVEGGKTISMAVEFGVSGSYTWRWNRYPCSSTLILNTHMYITSWWYSFSWHQELVSYSWTVTQFTHPRQLSFFSHELKGKKISMSVEFAVCGSCTWR